MPQSPAPKKVQDQTLPMITTLAICFHSQICLVPGLSLIYSSLSDYCKLCDSLPITVKIWSAETELVKPMMLAGAYDCIFLLDLCAHVDVCVTCFLQQSKGKEEHL